jgi:hypothetical protein
MLSVQGTFPQILAFLQRLERLQVLVKQQDLSLAMVEKPAGSTSSPEVIFLPGSSPILVMKLSLVFFDVSGDAAPGPQAPAAAPGPPPAPAAAPAPAAGSAR